MVQNSTLTAWLGFVRVRREGVKESEGTLHLFSSFSFKPETAEHAGHERAKSILADHFGR